MENYNRRSTFRDNDNWESSERNRRDNDYYDNQRMRNDYSNFNDDRNYDRNGGGMSYGSDSNRGYYGRDNDRNRWESNDYNRCRNWQSGGYYNSDYDNRSDYGNRSFDEWGNRNFDNRNRNFDEWGNRNRYSGDNRNSYRGNDNDRTWWDKTSDEVSSWFGDDEAEHRRKMDERSEGEHKGKGPKDYKRSSDRIREDVCDCLCDDDRVDASNIDVKVNGTEVTLTGTVDNKQSKRRAEDVVDSISGVTNVQNQLKVSNTSTQSSTTSGMTNQKGRSASSTLSNNVKADMANNS